MNKELISALIIGGLLLLESPEAAAYKEVRIQHRPSAHSYFHYRHEYRRAHQMPHWLKHDRSFRHWYKHTRLRRNHHLSWDRLFDIYRWEHFHSHYRRH
jgi:hypothetical protein